MKSGGYLSTTIHLPFGGVVVYYLTCRVYFGVRPCDIFFVSLAHADVRMLFIQGRGGNYGCTLTHTNG